MFGCAALWQQKPTNSWFGEFIKSDYDHVKKLLGRFG
jgi:hypothetical protein